MLVRVIDSASENVKKRVRLASKAHSDGLAASGFRLRQLTQRGMRQQAPGDIFWPPASPWVQFGPSLAGRARQMQRRIARRKSGPRGTDKPIYGTKGRIPLGRLAGAVRYQKKVQAGPDKTIAQTVVRIGFLTPAVARLAAYHATAHTVPVTPKMRRLIFAVGLGIKKTSITIPARPHVEPVYRKNQARIIGFVKKRTDAAWRGQDPRAIPPSF